MRFAGGEPMRGEADVLPAGRLAASRATISRPARARFDEEVHAALTLRAGRQRVDELAQVSESLLGVRVARRDDRILLGLDHEPAS